MDAILQIARRHELPVIEDAAQAFGAEYRGKPVGSLGNFGTVSFFPTKNLGALGDAGLLVTDDAALAEKARLLRDHGAHPRYFHSIIGGNFRLDALQAALLSVKLPHLSAYTAGRQRNACEYSRALEGLKGGDVVEILTPAILPDRTHISNQYTLRVRRTQGWQWAETPRDSLRRWLQEREIASEIYYPVSLHQQECFRSLGPYPALPVCEALADEVLSLPVFAGNDLHGTESRRRRCFGLRVFSFPASSGTAPPTRGTCVKRVLFIFGTRPEAIKLCPVIRYMRGAPGLEVRVCVTAQHRAMLDQVLESFEVTPDYDLDLMTPAQTLAQTTARIFTALDPVLADEHFDFAIVQGDTTTTMAGALCAFYRRIAVAHVEAGLRTGDLAHPFPEEMNRLVTARVGTLHFAPTAAARGNLIAEGIAEASIFVTGNTGIDAILFVADALGQGRLPARPWPWLNAGKKLIVVTAHRRENFGGGIERICDALAELSRREDVQLVYPVHRNPNVLDAVTHRLSALPNLVLTEPLDYVSFVDLMRRAYLLITDSGGIQEEGPSLGKPVLVMRERTERPEAVAAGTVKLVGTDKDKIVREAERLLTDEAEYSRMSRIHNPYGDGQALAGALRRSSGG